MDRSDDLQLLEQLHADEKRLFRGMARSLKRCPLLAMVQVLKHLALLLTLMPISATPDNADYAVV